MAEIRPTSEQLNKTFNIFLQKTPFQPKKQSSADASMPDAKIVQQEQKDKFEKKYGAYCTGAAVLTGFGILYFLKRGGKLINFSEFVKKHVNNITAKNAYMLNKLKNPDWYQTLKLKLSLLISSVLKKSQGLGNLNPIKDTIFYNFVSGIEKYTKIPVKKFFDSITNFLTRYGKKLAKSQYKTPQKQLKNLQNTLKTAADTIANLPNNKITAKEQAKIITKLKELSAFAEQEFGDITDKFDQRFDDILKDLKANAENEFWKATGKFNGGNISQKISLKIRELSDFIPLNLMKPYHEKTFKPLMEAKMKISNSIMDLKNTLNIKIDDIFYENGILNNENLRKSYLSLQDLTEKFANPDKYGTSRIAVREKLINKLTKTAKQFAEVLPYSEKSEQVSKLAELIKNDKKGAIEEAVSLCKILETTNPNLYAKLIKQRNSFQKSFNNAIKFETDTSYKKLLDFSLNSVPTDMMTQFVGLGTVGYILANRKKSMKEKIPAILKEGIPVAGGLAVAFLSNLRQVASGPSGLFLAILSGFALNRIGSVISNKYIEQNKNRAPKTDTK